MTPIHCDRTSFPDSFANKAGRKKCFFLCSLSYDWDIRSKTILSADSFFNQFSCLWKFKITYSSLNPTDLECKKPVDGINQWQPGWGSCKSLLEEPDMLFQSCLGEFPHSDNGRQTVCTCMLKCSITGMKKVFSSFSILNWVKKNWCCPFKCPNNM